MRDKFNKFKRKEKTVSHSPYKTNLAFDINEQLTEAAAQGDKGAVTKLLLQGADINHKSPTSGNTAFASAASHNDTSLAEFLLDQGADPRIEGKNGPALCGVNPRLIPRLLELGCNPNAADHDGTPLLRQTLGRDSAAAVKALLDHGADPQARGLFGATPLGNALFTGSPAMVEMLLRAGASPCRDEQGRYPEIIAAKQRYAVLEQMDRHGFLPGDWPTLAECRQCLLLAEQAVPKPVDKPRTRAPKAP